MMIGETPETNQARNWEAERATGKYVIEPYSIEDTKRWLAALSLPPMLEGEQSHQWAARIAAGREDSREAQDGSL